MLSPLLHVTEAILLANGDLALVILAGIGARRVDTTRDALHPRSQLAHLPGYLLNWGRISDDHLIEMIVNMVDSISTICVVSLVSQISVVCNVGAVGHRWNRHFTTHRIVLRVDRHAFC